MVSIITPAYNVQRFITASIHSVLNQTYNNWEMIIVDDGSTDNTHNIIEGFSSKDKRIKLLRHKKTLGAALARNTAINAATGNFIAFLDADDLWEPHKLATQIEFMRANNVAISFTSYKLIDEGGNSLNKVVQALPVVDYKKQLKCNYIGNLTGIYNVDLLSKIEIPKIKKRQDWVMWLSAIEKAGEARGIKEVLASYRVRKNSVSSNKMGLFLHNYNVYRKALGFGRIKSVIYLLRFLYEFFFIKSKQIKSV